MSKSVNERYFKILQNLNPREKTLTEKYCISLIGLVFNASTYKSRNEKEIGVVLVPSTY